MNRRTFIGTSMIGAAVAASRPGWAMAAQPFGAFSGGPMPAGHIEPVGLQLYTVRDLLKKDFDGTIAKVAEIGYKEVEFAGYNGKSPADVRKVLDANKLTSPSEHIPMETIEKKWPETLEAAHTVGQKFIVCPWMEVSKRNPDDFKRAAELFNRAGESAQKAGIQFAYHNHSFEFEPAEGLGGKMPYDFLLAETDPKLVKMELDLCWITVGGQDPVKYFEKYPGRFPLVHVKDWTSQGTDGHNYGDAGAKKPGHVADVGQGEIDWKRIFAHAKQAGILHYFVENDYPKEPFEAIKVSYNYLTKLNS